MEVDMVLKDFNSVLQGQLSGDVEFLDTKCGRSGMVLCCSLTPDPCNLRGKEARNNGKGGNSPSSAAERGLVSNSSTSAFILNYAKGDSPSVSGRCARRTGVRQ
jgi:hypothetical protein